MPSKINWVEIAANCKNRTKGQIKSYLRDVVGQMQEKPTVTDVVQATSNLQGLLYQVMMGHEDESDRAPNPNLSMVNGRQYKLRVLSRFACFYRDENENNEWRRHGADEKPQRGDVVLWSMGLKSKDANGLTRTGQELNEMRIAGEDIHYQREFIVDEAGCILVDFEYAYRMLLKNGPKVSPAFKNPKKGAMDAAGNPSRKIVNRLFEEVPVDWRNQTNPAMADAAARAKSTGR